MRKTFAIPTLLLPYLALAQIAVNHSEADEKQKTNQTPVEISQENDSVKSEQLNEVVVQASPSIETGSKTILYPTKIEKQHSTNGYELLANMNLPDFEVRAGAQQISTLNGKEVVVLINGVEALNDELATLSGSDIVSIDLQRNPTGKYAGKGAVMNFITRQYEYGVNAYLSYGQGFTHLYGDYLGMVSYKRKAFSVALTTSAKWDKIEELNPAENWFEFSQGTLYQRVTTLENHIKNNSQYGRLNLSHSAINHSLSFSISLHRTAQPKRLISEDVDYQGIWNGTSQVEKQSRERALSPVLTFDYSLSLPKSQYLSIQANSSLANSRIKSHYLESANFSTLQTTKPKGNARSEPGNVSEIQNNTKEKSTSLNLWLTYKKSFSNGISVGTSLSDSYQRYRDDYSGSFTDRQTLSNNLLIALASYSHTLTSQPLSYYLNLGASLLESRLNRVKDSQWHPITFYGVTYSPNQSHSLSFEGMLGHNTYDPAYKNDAIIFSTPFQATIGNPSLKPFTALENSLSYNGRIKNLRLYGSYDFVEYFDNLVNNYFVEDGIVFRQLQNDGNFYFHTLRAGVSLNLFQGRLSVGGNGLVSYTYFGSKTRPTKATIFRGSLNAIGFLGPWRLRVFYAPQRKAMNWDGTKLLDPTQYGLNAQWKNGNWTVECSIENFLRRYQGQKARMDGGCYKTSRTYLTTAQGRNISLKVVYTLSYGKKSHQNSTEMETKIDNRINSAILRPF